MVYVLFALFLAIPLTEVALFIVVGGHIGIVATIAITVLTALAGAVLVRQQGLATLERVRRELDEDRIPVGSLGEGLAILVAGAFLLTPGFFTDALGFILLVPPLRRRIVTVIGQWIGARVVVSGRHNTHADSREGGPVIEGEAVEIKDAPPSRPNPNSPWRGR
jgi:UPF0716 protein FxsA